MKFTEKQAMEAIKQHPIVAYKRGLTLPEYTLYQAILDFQMVFTVLQLMKVMGDVERSTIQRQLHKLEEKGYMRSYENPNNTLGKLWTPAMSTQYCPVCYSTNLHKLSTQFSKICADCHCEFHWPKEEGEEDYV